MSSELEENFTITWRVKNFNMCAAKLGSFIITPDVLVRQFGNSKWRLLLYPKGREKESFVACFLECTSLGVYETETIDVNMELSVTKSTDRKGKPRKNFHFPLNGAWGYNLIRIEEIINEKELTISCSMKCKNPSKSKNYDEEIIKALSRNSISEKNSLYTNKCYCETTIQVQNKRFLWLIQRFSSLNQKERITLPVFSAMKETPSFIVTLFKNGEFFINIEIRRNDEKSKDTFVKCNLSAVNASEDYFLVDVFLFKSEDDVWTFSPLLELSLLEEELKDDALYLQFDFAFSVQDQLHHIEKQGWEPPIPLTKSLVPLELFTTPTANEEHTVVTLRAEHKTFTVPKALLEAKSKKFGAMFENDMETDVVDIPDVEPETLGRMLSFFYSGTVSDISTTDVKSLYAAAHKYQVLSLMDYCSSVLMSSLTVSNVCDMVKFADLYRDERLLKAVEDFLIADSDADRILISQDWEDLLENNLPFAANIMYKMLIK